MKTIKIKPFDNFELYFTLVLCKTRKQMQYAIRKHNPKCEILTKNTSGMVSPNDFITYDKLDGKFRSNYIGKMFLNLDDLKDLSQIVAHECAHMAFDFNHYVLRYYGNYWNNENHGEYEFLGGGDIQETFCYFLENAYKKVWQEIKLYKRELNDRK